MQACDHVQIIYATQDLAWEPGYILAFLISRKSNNIHFFVNNILIIRRQVLITVPISYIHTMATGASLDNNVKFLGKKYIIVN